MAEKKQISINEFREWLGDNTGIDLFDDDIINNEVVQQKEDELKQQFNMKNTDNKINPEDKDKLQIQKENIRKCKMCKEHQHALCDKPEWCKCKHGE